MIIIKDKNTEYTLQVLARHKMIDKLLADIVLDMKICELRGWDVFEYINMIKKEIDKLPRRAHGKQIAS